MDILTKDDSGFTTKVTKLHHWPSWLRRGSKTIVTNCYEFFYGQEPRPEGFCPLCGVTTEQFWTHVLSPCPVLSSISEDPAW